MVIGGYTVTALIYESTKTRIYRAVRDGGRYVLKTVKASSPTTADLAGLRHEYAVLKDLKIEGVVKAIELVSFENGLVLVLESFENGQTLRQVCLPEIVSPSQGQECGGTCTHGC